MFPTAFFIRVLAFAVGGLGLFLSSISGLWAEPPVGYYDSAAGFAGGPLKQALHGVIADHTVIPYANILAPLKVIWRDPANPANILLTYSRTSVQATSNWNREHLWPRARGNSDQAGPDDSDLFHVVPTDVSVNAERGSLYFDVSDPGDPAYRIPAHSLAPQTSRDSDSWQPAPEERGDIARALFYMDVCYDGSVPQTTDMDLVSFPPSGSQMGRLNTLLLWNEQDPPDDAERARNDLIYTTYQHNRNPFIDHPEWVAEIWGTGVPNSPGSRPIARVELVAASASEMPQASARLQIALNQFAGAGGVSVSFSMAGTAQLSEYTLGGASVTFDPATGLGSIWIPENFSNALINLTPINDGIAEPSETAILTLVAGDGYTIVPGATSTSTVRISDGPSLPASWNFNSGAPYATPLPANLGGGSISFSDWRGTVSSFGGTSGMALALVGNAGNGSWIDLHLSMTGYTNLALRFFTRGTTSGYNSGVWSASVDGVNFTALSGVNTATQGINFVQRDVDFSSLGQLTDAAEVTLRYTLSGATSTTGNNRIDELSVSASPLVTGNALRTVTIAASDASASETPLDPGTFTVQLNGSAPAGGLDVVLSFANGTATAPGYDGADYTLDGLASYDAATRTGHVFFAEGQRAALVTVTPVADTLAEASETVIAQIGSSDRYLVGGSNQAIIRIVEPLINDAFASALPLFGKDATATGTNIGATFEPGEVKHYSSTGGHSVWWKWTAPEKGIVQIGTGGSDFDTILAVYTGNVLASLTRLASDDDSGAGTTSLVEIRVMAGTTYYIAVDGYGSSTGNIALALHPSPPLKVGLSTIWSQARETGFQEAEVQIRLDRTVPFPIVVNFALSGTAEFGVDYSTATTSSTTVTIPAYTLYYPIRLTPIYDENVLEGTETIQMDLVAGADYLLDPALNNRAELTLEDRTPYSAAWIAAHPGLTEALASPLEDGDGDGMPSLLEYVLDRDPTAFDGGDALRISAEDFIDPLDNAEKTYAAIRFRRRLDSRNVGLSLLSTDDLANGYWRQDAVFVSATPLEEIGMEELLYRGDTPLGDASVPHYFFRLQATVP